MDPGALPFQVLKTLAARRKADGAKLGLRFVPLAKWRDTPRLAPKGQVRAVGQKWVIHTP